MLTINKCHTDSILSMPIAQSKRKLIAATALLIAVGTLTATIGLAGVATVSLAQTTASETGGNTTTAREQPGQHHQSGTVTSAPSPLPGREDEESAMILAPTPRGDIYAGQITYTASEPVQVAVLQMQDLNATERQIVNATDSPFGTLPTTQLDNNTSVVVTLIGAPADSGSVWFAGNAVLLHSTDGTPFVATYTLSADEHRPAIENHISNATTATTEGGGGDGGGDGGGGGGGE
jgi:hypothetical protein